MASDKSEGKFSEKNADEGRLSEEDIEERRKELKDELARIGNLVSRVRAASDEKYNKAVEKADGDHRKVER